MINTKKQTPYLAIVKRSYKSNAQLGEVINRSARYVRYRINGQADFTDREKKMILRDIGMDPTPEAIAYVFEKFPVLVAKGATA